MARIAGRDINAAENIARLLFAALLGIDDRDRGMWSIQAYDTKSIGAHHRSPDFYNINYADNPPPSWEEIYAAKGFELPFQIAPVKPARPAQPAPPQQHVCTIQ